MQTDKARLRAMFRGKRQAFMDAGCCGPADAAITAHILSSELYRSAGSVFCYVSMPGEPDTCHILEDALRTGKEVYVPKCLPGGRMLAVRIRSLAELAPGMLSIPEPVGFRDANCAAARQPDLILVPCVSVTREGIRLGHGGGYYDRFLAEASGQAAKNDGPRRPVTLCLCYEALLAEDLPADVHDVPMDWVVTESGIIRSVHC